MAIVKSDDVTTGQWVPFVNIEDLDATVAQAEDAGGKVVIPRSIGPAGEYTTVAAPARALVAFWVPFTPVN